MPKLSKNRIRRISKMKDKVRVLDREGLTLREISETLEKKGFKRSYTWVFKVLREL